MCFSALQWAACSGTSRNGPANKLIKTEPLGSRVGVEGGLKFQHKFGSAFEAMWSIEYDLLLMAAHHYVYLKKKKSLIWRIVIAYYARNSVPHLSVWLSTSLRSMLLVFAFVSSFSRLIKTEWPENSSLWRGSFLHLFALLIVSLQLAGDQWTRFTLKRSLVWQQGA